MPKRRGAAVLFLAVCGGIVGAVGMESELARKGIEPAALPEAADHERRRVAV